jgi:acetolactate decarboxylase
MRRLLTSTILALAVASVGWAEAVVDRDTVFQVSTIGALLRGLFDGMVTVRQLRAHGDFGIGTFDALDGEMLVNEGVFYQIRSDGTCRRRSGAARSPFAAVTFFEADRTIPIAGLDVPDGVDDALKAGLPTPNVFYAIRITGEFGYVKARSVPRQTKPYPSLTEVVKTQPVFEYRDLPGTLVGFRSPPFVEGLNVPGYHFHFIDAEGKVGGHVLECRLRTGTAQIDLTPSIHVTLPGSPAFYQLDLSTPNAQDVQRVEK